MHERSIRRRLLEALAEVPVIDAHEHLPPEHIRLGSPVDFSTLFSHYTQTDLEAAGMTQEQYDAFQSSEMDLDDKWRLFSPFWERIRYGSYSRPALIAAREFYGCEDISQDTYRVLSQRMQEANTPGIYKRVLRDRCNIRLALTQVGYAPEQDRDLLVPLLPLAGWPTAAGLAKDREHGDCPSFQELREKMREVFARRRDRDGVVGMKMMSHQMADPSQEEACRAFDSPGTATRQEAELLNAYLLHEAIEVCGELKMPVAVHCGIIWDNWNDFYTTHPKHMIPVMLKHRKTRFDLYHAAIPWVREMAVIGKDFPNAYLNLCWCHIVSPQMTVSALDEWIDMVPVHKILGFGGDYSRPVEKVYGHLQMAKEDICRVLARRVADDLLTVGQAVALGKRMLFDNPKELYRLEV